MRKRLFLFIFLAGKILLSHSQNAQMLSLDELLSKGVEHSLTVQSLQQELDMIDDQYALAKNKRLPQIGVTAEVGFAGQPVVLNTDLSHLSDPYYPRTTQNYEVMAIQPIYEGGKIKNGIEKAALEQQVGQLNLEMNKSSVKLALVRIYLSLCDLYQEQAIYKEYIEEAKIRVKNIRKMNEQGIVTSNDVLRSEIQESDYELACKEVTNNIALASQQLAIALGMDESIVFAPDTTILNRDNDITFVDYFVQRAYQNNRDLGTARIRTDMAKKDLNIAKSNYLPALSVVAANTLQRPIPYISPTEDLFLNTWGVVLSVSYHPSNLFDKKRTLSSAKSKISQQELAEDLQKQNIRINVKTYYTRYTEAIDRINTLEKTFFQSQDNYRIMDKKYFNQLAILTDLLDANLVRLNTQLSLTKAKVNKIYAYYQLQDICGEL